MPSTADSSSAASEARTLSCAAPGKLNLFLLITGRRDDGYHTLQTLFRFIDFGDTLNAVSPLATLDRGYAILFDRKSGQVVRSIAQVAADSTLRARVADGEVDLRVDSE